MRVTNQGRGLRLSPFSACETNGGTVALDSSSDDATNVVGDGVGGGEFPAAGVGERAGHEAVERGSLRRDGEGLDRRGCDSQRWTAGGGAGEFCAVCDREELCLVDGERCCGQWLSGAGWSGFRCGCGDEDDAGRKDFADF